jgi:NAD-dependent deacetylase
VPAVPRCAACGAPLKPNVVLFGEPVRGMGEIESGLRDCDLLLVIGTSAQVYPAAAIPERVREAGGRILEFNLEETRLTRRADLLVRGPASRTLPALADTVLGGG